VRQKSGSKNNKEGFPASSFRTDDWPLCDPENDEAIGIAKPDIELKRSRKQKGLLQAIAIEPVCHKASAHIVSLVGICFNI